MTMAFQPHSFMFQPHEEDHHHHHHHHHHSNINIASNPNSALFHGSGHHAPSFALMKRSLSFDHDREGSVLNMLQGGASAAEEELSDDGSQSLGEKKKRLNLEQVKTLEKSFEMGNKLEPERKLQLAKALGLQPRQVAIWFQNRRARWKTKQLEKDYDVLRKQFDALKADNDSLHAQNKKLHAQLSALKGRDYSSELAGRENHKKDQADQGSWSNGSDQNSSEINLDISRTTPNINVNNNPSTSSASSHQQAQLIHGKNLFPSNLRPASSITQLLQGSSRSDLQCLKLDNPQQMLQSDESFCNMFVNGSAAAAVETDQPQAGFWPWPEQHYFH